jgi:hypothetical protein
LFTLNRSLASIFHRRLITAKESESLSVFSLREDEACVDSLQVALPFAVERRRRWALIGISGVSTSASFCVLGGCRDRQMGRHKPPFKFRRSGVGIFVYSVTEKKKKKISSLLYFSFSLFSLDPWKLGGEMDQNLRERRQNASCIIHVLLDPCAC